MEALATTSWWLLAIVSFLAQHICGQQNGLRLCVPDTFSTDCHRMQATVGQNRLQCITARDRLECMDLVRQGRADLVSADAEDVMTAGHHFGLAPYVMEEVSRVPYVYRSAAVILRSSTVRSLRDLRGLRACMDRCGGSRTSDAGWHMPLAALLDRRVMDPDCRGEEKTVAKFFNGACVQGPWSSSPVVDVALKRETPSLCAQCSDQASCSSVSETSSSSGTCGPASALRCLSEGRGDVAFVDPQDVADFLLRNPDHRIAMDFLCLDGTRRPLREVQDGSGPGCVWNQRPTAVFMGDAEKVNQRYQYSRTLRQVFQNHRVRPPAWFRRILVTSEMVTDLQPVQDQRDSWQTYLGGYRIPLEMDLPNCDAKQLRLCVVGDAEASKCNSWSWASLPRGLRPKLGCQRRDTRQECIDAVAGRQADLTVVSASDVYRLGRTGRSLQPLASEMQGEEEKVGNGGGVSGSNVDEDFQGAYAVAVVRKNSAIQNIEELRGKRSCHSSMNDPAGWTLPLSVLLESGAMDQPSCNRTDTMNRFFSAGSCAPGARNGSALCVLCRGDESSYNSGSNHCEPDLERYAGDEGAFRCLAEGTGDVAFVRHWAPLFFAHRGSVRRQYGPDPPGWARNLGREEFLLLCSPGPQDDAFKDKDTPAVAPLVDFRRCNWGKVPPDYVMTSSKASEETKLDAAKFLAESSRTFSPGSRGSSAFKLFGGSFANSSSDLSFFESVSGLKILPLESTYREALDPKYLSAVESADSEQCSQRLTDGATGSSILGRTFWVVLLIGFFFR